jgi:ATP-dependent Lon protease
VSQFLIDDLKREVVLKPHDPQPRFALAEAFFGDGQYASAVKQLEKALQIADDGWADAANARRLLAKALERDGREAEALKHLEEMARRDPRDLAARDELMEMLLAIGRVDDALLHAEEATKIATHDPRRWVTVAELCRMKMLFDRARTAMETAQRLAPEDAQIRENLKELYLEVGDEAASERLAGLRNRAYYVAQARQALGNERVRKTMPPGLEAAARALADGDVPGCKRALMQAPVESRATGAYDFLRGEVLLIEGELERADKAFRACVERAADFGMAYNRLGDLQQSQGALKDAVPFYKKALLFCPDDANAYEDLGDLYATLGDRDEAERMYAEASKLHPDGKAAAKRRSLVEPARKVGIGLSDVPAVGRIGVLGWTPRGGAVSPLEAVAVPGKGELIFSGNVGPTGREAGQVAFSCLKARARELGIESLVTTQDLHLHFTDTEFGKDGPSSGLALVLAGVSAYTQLPLRPWLAATGEITILGEVKPVGGIHEKVVAAHLQGIRTVLLPRRNLREGRDLPHEVADRIELIYVDGVAEAIERALVKG